MKKLMAVLSVTLLLWGCSDNNNKVEEESVKEEKIEAVEEKEETVVEEVEEEIEEAEDIDEEAEEVKYSREDRISVVSASMSESYSGMAEVEYDSSLDTITILPTDEQFILELAYTSKGYKENVKAWNGFVESLSELSSTVSGIVDEDIMIAILNPADSDKILLLIQDGFVLYDFVDEI